MSVATKNTASHHHLEVNVPNHWQVVPLENILSGIVGGGTPSRSKASYWEGSIPWLTVKDMRTRRPSDAIDHISEKAVMESATNIIPPDTLIIATRVGLGKIIRVPFAAAINQDLKALITKPEVDRSYLEYWLMCIADYLGSIGSGTTVKGIRLEQLRSLPVPLAPLEDQKKIVAEIEKQFSRLDEAVTSLKRAKANLKRYKAAVLKAAVEGKLTEEWRKQHPDVEPAAELLERILADRHRKWEEVELDELFPIPGKWAWARLSDVFDVITDGDHQAPPKSNAGIPFLVIGNLSSGNLDFSSTRFVTKQYYDSLAVFRKPQKGDLLYTVVGSYGIPVKVDTDIPFCVQRHVAILKPNVFVLCDYLYYVLLSSSVYEQSTKVATGTAQKTVPLGGLRNIRIPIPPLDEQVEIVSVIDVYFSSVISIENTIEEDRKRGDRIKQAILSQAYRRRGAEKA